MRPGELYISDSCNLWNGPANTSPGIIVGYLQSGDLVLVLDSLGNDIKVLTPHGIGWIDILTMSGKRSLHETR